MMKVIQQRRSVRKYLPKPVEEEKLHEILESARWAPSGNNTQPWKFIVVTSDSLREKLALVSHQQRWMMTAPVHIVCVADPGTRYPSHQGPVIDENSPENELKQVIRDTAIAVEHLVLEAENQGLGTCWVAWFTQEEIRPILEVPENKYVVAVITVGYAAVTPAPTPRRKLEELILHEKWTDEK